MLRSALYFYFLKEVRNEVSWLTLLYPKLYKCSSRENSLREIRACIINCYTPTQKTAIIPYFEGKRGPKI